MAIDYKKWFMVGAIGGLLTPVLVWIVGLIPFLSNILKPYVTGIDSSLAIYVLGLLGGKFELPGVLISIIGGGLLTILGAIVYSHGFMIKDVPILKGDMEKMTFVLIYASLFASVIMIGFKLPTIPTLIAMIINAIVTATFISEILDKRLKIVSVP